LFGNSTGDTIASRQASIDSPPDQYEVFSALVNEIYVKDKVKLIVIVILASA
jgi:hypothetical protein